MKIVRISKPKRTVVLAFLSSPNGLKHMLETESRNHQIFRFEVAASCSVAKVPGTGVCGHVRVGLKDEHQFMLPHTLFQA
jgi:hypothetical protein